MSPAPEPRSKPKSDAIPATRLGPRAPECPEPACPMREYFTAFCERIESKVDKIDDTVNGTDEKPGIAERIRLIELVLKLIGAGAGIAASVIITIFITRLMGG